MVILQDEIAMAPPIPTPASTLGMQLRRWGLGAACTTKGRAIGSCGWKVRREGRVGWMMRLFWERKARRGFQGEVQSACNTVQRGVSCT